MGTATNNLSPVSKLGLGVVGILQVAFASLAFWDLAHRDTRDVVGSKSVWVPVILVNWIGPASYFLFGIRR
ncbi:PLDc N-terminal domain-containing protein [Microbacterium sp. SSW1-59]|uniref:PLDc N-terminal domain-containing protein n=1 Tax=Microbacterium xanthum TaxID=3079794 RepID=UPI002AD5276E|nr:PLDc N-terminal domain-containing protein [Microbacterium sp. SSW1-59]MDZ8202097.1 PLDc N-terminal domain-containing protein [Microbacterium sp. SSW1-59]